VGWGILLKDKTVEQWNRYYTGSLAGREKLAGWKAFLDAEEDPVYCISSVKELLR